jgi:hypothetical protein
MTRCLLVFALAFSVAGFWAEGAAAQTSSLYAQNQMNAINARNSAASFAAPQLGRPKSKPFSNFVGQGSVTPWLALSQPFTSPTTNYFSNVRPQLDQQRANQQMAARNAQMQRQLNTLAAQAPYNPAGSENMAPTGHVATYMNFGGYYTPVQPTKQQR